jgi:hypothetical protein
MSVQSSQTQGAGKSAVSPERRRSSRRQLQMKAFLSSPTGGRRIAVESVDLSKHGIGLRLAQPIASGTYHVLELDLGDQKLVNEVLVLSCAAEGAEGTYHIHARFC